MKKLIAGGATAALVTGALFAPSVWAGSKTVQVKDNKFGPTSITVRRGTTVKWVWKGHAPHNVTVTKGPKKFHSTTQTKGSFSKRLTRKGTYTILCTIHAPDMKMTVKVK
jgi:plastocyanin